LVWLTFLTAYSFLMISPNLHDIWVVFRCQRKLTRKLTTNLSLVCQRRRQTICHRYQRHRREILLSVSLSPTVENICTKFSKNCNCQKPYNTITLQRTNTKNSKQIFPVPISTFMCLWAIYIFPGSVTYFLQQNR
jgi:hypothetical protein